jgi:hypothetical protein
MSKAISPDQVAAHKASTFPDYVFDAFNDLIAANFTAGDAVVLQKDVIALILAKANAGLVGTIDDSGLNLTRNEIFSKGYLNVEEVYREAGWQVEYDKPAYNESYDASFTFRKKK